MLNSGCDCCIVNGANISINSVSVYKTCEPKEEQCAGFIDPEDTSECPTRYRTRITTGTVTDSYDTSISCEGFDYLPPYGLDNTGTMSATITQTTTCVNGVTTEITNQSGSSNSIYRIYLCDGGDTEYSLICDSTLTNDGWSGSVVEQGDSFETTSMCWGSDYSNYTTTYSDPIEVLFITDPECEETEIPFPEFPDKCQFGCQTDGDCDDPPDLEEGQGYDQNAFDFSLNGEIVEQKFNYKIVHSAPSTCYLKIWTREKIYKYVKKTPDPTDLENPCYPQSYQYWEADEEEPFSYGSEQTYIWSGPTVKNGLCVDPEKGVGHCDNYEESSVRTVNATNGQEVFLEMKYSFVEGYEPDWPDEPNSCKPNGFPNTNCE
jgi:hypothetical protein